MKRVLLILTVIAALPTIAQQAAQPLNDSQKPAAVINGEIISKAKLDALYANIPAPTRAQYDQAGGKRAFLDNYVAKRLLIQEAMKTGFDQRADTMLAMEAARESALFDRYIRDVVASDVVSESDIRKYYDERMNEFRTPEQVKVRHILVAWNKRTKEQARERAEQVLAELLPYRLGPNANTDAGRQIFLSRFADAARRYSEDGTAPDGGDLGWASRGRFDKAFDDAAFGMQPGVMSGIIESQYGYHLILVESKKEAGVEPFQNVRNEIREFLVGQKTTEIMALVKRLTNELRQNSRVAVYPENLD